jgi:hypothetical protein
MEAYIDYNKAFDSVEQDSVLEMRRIGIHLKYIRMVGKIYSNSRAKVRTEKEWRLFRVKRGVRQGDPISPKLVMCPRRDIQKNEVAQKKIRN